MTAAQSRLTVYLTLAILALAALPGAKAEQVCAVENGEIVCHNTLSWYVRAAIGAGVVAVVAGLAVGLFILRQRRVRRRMEASLSEVDPPQVNGPPFTTFTLPSQIYKKSSRTSVPPEMSVRRFSPRHTTAITSAGQSHFTIQSAQRATIVPHTIGREYRHSKATTKGAVDSYPFTGVSSTSPPSPGLSDSYSVSASYPRVDIKSTLP